MFIDEEETQFYCVRCNGVTDVEDESPDSHKCEWCYCEEAEGEENYDEFDLPPEERNEEFQE